MTITERINEIQSFVQDECWYITKHPLSFSDLCYATQIVEDYQKGNSSKNFADFFNQDKALIYGISPNHRMTNNCYYLGLLEKTTSEYKDAIPTNVFYEIKKKCNGNFKDLELFKDIMINQIEKLFLTNEVDRASNTLRKNFKIHPAFFLVKVLIELGGLTENYSISLNEFYKYVGTSLNFKYYFSTVSLIIESRKNIVIDNNFNFLVNFFEKTNEVSSNNFTNNRIHLLLKNLPYFNIENSNISLNLDYLSILKEKLYYYEKNYNEEIFTIEFLNSTKSFAVTNIKINNFNNQDVNNIIYYGSPGTGKSHRADIETNGKDVQKVTFHPDYDYHSFVGGYKPTMDGDKIAYKFVPQIFIKIYVDAWKNLVSADETKPFYLQIEEINRGNCAEIFGDLFQLLDRDKDGFSKYEVTAEEELNKYLLSENGFGGDHPGIENGKLRFPNNLKIIATMNTSDQSLFPMDSAFKRRWDWIYIPIDTDCKFSDFTIQLDNGKAFEWLSFLKVINEEIFEITKSQDKQIGNWFIDAQNTGKVITESTFVNKVIFYLWNDVFKDEENTIFKAADGRNLTYTSFFENDTSNNLVSYILEERLNLIDVNKAEPTTTEEE
jgi:hypothetical protein